MKFKEGDKVTIIYTWDETDCPEPAPGNHVKKEFIGEIVDTKVKLYRASAKSGKIHSFTGYRVEFKDRIQGVTATQGLFGSWYQNLPEENLQKYSSVEEILTDLDKLIKSKELQNEI